MKYFEWLNKEVGNYDVFLIANKKETEDIVRHFATEYARGCKSKVDDEWYYFLNTNDMTITPMPILSLAFGGQYNGDLPFGKELVQFNLRVEDYALQLFLLTLN